MYDDSVADYARITVIATGLTDAAPKAGSSFGGRSNASSPFSVRKPAAQTGAAKQAGGINMPSFSLANMNSSYGTKMPTSTVQKKDIQIPDFPKTDKTETSTKRTLPYGQCPLKQLYTDI